ncbi:bactofilin family protein [Brassicibacter mesophilus]|uniref:bactofilin family protein n=1 Tax=Brassicibacter mesophilus TaxID=745119 RepID=UPI003D257EBD
MFKKVTNLTQENLSNRTIIDKEAKINGDIAAKDVDILGFVEGNIDATGKVTVIGTVKGNITGMDIAINGRIYGNIISSGLVYVDKDAVITGDIEFGSILVEDGAILKGTFKASEKGQTGRAGTGGVKIRWGKDVSTSKEAKIRLNNLINKTD